ncbi:MAG: 4-(cytidine 5'-diphospho)-2-C-methyl-D-erythritol kinase [Mucispirillum sp.]|nr:4-(cytidine 5'-diphospho)-2-C-methyl-D-erythritol kinase [Mucispirillum sp.]
MENQIHTYLCPAKVNLFLYVLGRRADGYHDIFTLFYPVSIYDTLSIQKSDKTTLTCSNKNIPEDDNNIIIKTHNILKEKYNLQDNFNITLKKNIPFGAGLGGGSSNAAYYLKAVNEISGLCLNYEQMAEIMAMVGSDTVFFLKNIPQLALGRGTKLTPAPLLPELYFIIINPNIYVSTKEIYNSNNLEFTKLDTINIKKEYTFNELKSIMKNDMQQAVFSLHKQVEDIVHFLSAETAGFSLMSGSGSTVFAVYPDKQAQEEAYNKAKTNFKTYFVKKAATAARG